MAMCDFGDVSVHEMTMMRNSYAHPDSDGKSTPSLGTNSPKRSRKVSYATNLVATPLGEEGEHATVRDVVPQIDQRPHARVKTYRRMGYVAALIIYLGCAALTLVETKQQPADEFYWKHFAAAMLVSFLVVEPAFGCLTLLYHWLVTNEGEERNVLELHPIEGKRYNKLLAPDSNISSEDDSSTRTMTD